MLKNNVLLINITILKYRNTTQFYLEKNYQKWLSKTKCSYMATDSHITHTKQLSLFDNM